ncbi:MAG TPA: glycosyltransferase, partial [Chloroflexota bacterium]|nr:glycosyltransferase [Chloroflexota bacterium]
MVTAFDHYCLSDQTSDAETPDATRARRFANAPLASIVAMVGRGERRVEGKVRSITVVIPTHNRPKLLAEAVRSVLRSPLIESPSQVVIVDND